MITVLNSKGVRVNWTICKRPGVDAENFDLAEVVVFARGGGDVYTLVPNSTSNGVLDFSFDQGVTPAVGVYDLKAL